MIISDVVYEVTVEGGKTSEMLGSFLKRILKEGGSNIVSWKKVDA